MSEERIDVKKLKTLDDFPSLKDEFLGNSHENVAEALFKIISSNKGGYAIGLEGTWGSGKSTIINITESKFQSGSQNGKYLLFNFDSWAHQGDPIRRSFLECLIRFLEKNGIVSEKKWGSKLSIIRSQQKKVVSESVPKVPNFNLLMILYGLCLPFIFIGINGYFSNADVLNTLILPVLIVLLIPVATAYITCIHRVKTDSEFKNLPVIPSARYLTEKTKTEQYIHTNDATTIEFNKYFDDLVKEVKNKKGKLIVVIDNLDRLSPDGIKSIWGTMRNFFSAEHWSERQQLLENVFLIVPYDPNYISQVFSEDQNMDASNDTSINVSGVPFQSIRSNSGFIDKTFKLGLQVTSPILSDWKGFFSRKLDLAFENQLERLQKHQLFKLFEFKFQSDSTKITPRNIKNFINSLVVQVIEWDNKIPLLFLGLYVLHKEKIGFLNHRNVHQDLNAVIDSRTRNYLAGENWQRYLVAAYHKVDPDQALEVTYRDTIRESLLSGEVDNLNELSNNDWFGDVLTHVVEDFSENWASTEPKTYSTVASNLTSINLDEKVVLNDIWNNLANNLSRLGKIDLPNKEMAEGFKLIIENSTEKSLLRASSSRLYRQLNISVPEDYNPIAYATDYAKYISVVNSALNKVLGKKFSKRLLKEVSLPREATYTIYIAEKLCDENQINFSDVDVTVPDKEVLKVLVEFTNKRVVYVGMEKAIQSFLDANIKLEWSKIVSSIQNRMNNNDPGMSGEDIENLLAVLILFDSRNEGNSSSILTQLYKNGVLIALLDKTQKNPKASALIILAIIKQVESFETIDPNQNVPKYGRVTSAFNRFRTIAVEPNDHSQILNEMVRLACKYEYFQIILNSISKNPPKFGLLRLLGYRLIEDECIKGINPNSIIRDFGLISFIGEESKLKDLFTLLDEENISSLPNLDEISTEFLEHSIHTDSQLGRELETKIKGELKKYSAESWEEVLNEEKHEVKLVLKLLDLGIDSFLSEDFSEALYKHSIKLLDDIDSIEIISGWNLLPKVLQENTRIAFYERIFAELISKYRDSDNAFSLLTLYEDEIIDVPSLDGKSDLFIENVVIALVNSDELEKLNWVGDHIGKIEQAYKDSKRETKGHFEELLKGKESEYDEVREKIYEIASSLKIDLN